MPRRLTTPLMSVSRFCLTTVAAILEFQNDQQMLFWVASDIFDRQPIRPTCSRRCQFVMNERAGRIAK